MCHSPESVKSVPQMSLNEAVIVTKAPGWKFNPDSIGASL
jgi:hypothetical protein